MVCVRQAFAPQAATYYSQQEVQRAPNRVSAPLRYLQTSMLYSDANNHCWLEIFGADLVDFKRKHVLESWKVVYILQ
jgi:hypothetical protein